MKKTLILLSGLVTMSLAATATSEALAVRGAVRAASCGSYNWCAPSQGGQTRCDECCGGEGGFCYDAREDDNFQGCLCLN
jgi:hypothetical protein